MFPEYWWCKSVTPGLMIVSSTLDVASFRCLATMDST
jgi:hypothetical protein